jgi:hypothetical protein
MAGKRRLYDLFSAHTERKVVRLRYLVLRHVADDD